MFKTFLATHGCSREVGDHCMGVRTIFSHVYIFYRFFCFLSTVALLSSSGCLDSLTSASLVHLGFSF